MTNFIKIRGAREHNLKNVNLDIPKNKLVVFTGVSGSGKSSLALDTIYAEGRRRYVESLSSYARKFLGGMHKPDVETIEGLSPAIAISQKKPFHNPRSTVGTITEIYDYLRLLFSRIGHPHCPQCGREVKRQSIDEIIEAISAIFANTKKKRGTRLLIIAPIIKDRKGEYSALFENLKKQGFSRARVDGNVRSLDDDFMLIKTNRHSIEAIIDRVVLGNKKGVSSQNQRSRLHDAISQALNISGGEVIISEVLDRSFDFPEQPKKMHDHLFSELFACPKCNISLAELEPRSFSFNSPHGACPKCSGLGTILRVDQGRIYNPRLTINEGGFLPLSSMTSSNTWYHRLVEAVAKEYNINLDTPIGQLPPKHLEIMTNGTGRRKYMVRGKNSSGVITGYRSVFRGFAPEVEKIYRETASDRRRAEMESYMLREECPTCHGTRLKSEALSVTILDQNIAEVSSLSIAASAKWIQSLSDTSIGDRERLIAEPIIREISSRLAFLNSVGLSYLTLDRAAATLSGGEAQRIRLASQISSGLSGVVYVLDEPSIGLHHRDMGKLVSTLKGLRDLDNTVIVVEHDPLTIREADWVADFGPGGGSWGGRVVAQGSPQDIMSSKDSITGDYLAHRKEVTVDETDEPALKARPAKILTIIGARQHNLKNIDVEFPLGKFICVTGVSGSGKSTLVQETLNRSLRRELGMKISQAPGDSDGLLGANLVDKVYEIDQSPIGQTPRSNPATYTKAFDYIREAFARTKEARLRGYDKGHFSFNTKGGRCEACEGQGIERIEMQFLPDVYVTCEVCNGARYNQEALEVEYRGKNIKEILDMTVNEALNFFSRIPPLVRRLTTLSDVGLGYIELGQPAPTLSGGEAQRVRLAKELAKKPKGHTFYILDEPTIGLHPDDITHLLTVLYRLVARGNTVLVIEHNLDVMKNAGWFIDFGPEGGEGGGEVVCYGTPEQISQCESSYTGQALKGAN